MTIWEKLTGLQNELNAPKNQYNSFGKYKYRSCEDILQAVKPLLKKWSLAMTVSDGVELIGERYYIAATVTVYDIEAQDKLTVTAYARESEDKKGMDASQITGTASSYARKYALNGMFAIDDNKDADTDDFKRQQQHETPICSVCGNPVKAVKGRDGSIKSPEEVITACGGMCAGCYQKANSDAKE